MNSPLAASRPRRGLKRTLRALARAVLVLAACLWFVFGTDIPQLFAAAPLVRGAVLSSLVQESRFLALAAPAPEFVARENPTPVFSRAVFYRGAATDAGRIALPVATNGAPTEGDAAFIRRTLRALSPLCRIAWG